MPLYNYKCKHCGQSLEVLRRITESDTPPTEQEVAGLSGCKEGQSSHDLERRIGPTSFQLIGGGWFNSPY